MTPVDAPDREAIQAAVDRIADAVDPQALGVELADLAIREIPELAKRADDDLRQAARTAATQSLADVWDGARAGITRDLIAPPRGGLEFAYELVHRGVDLEALLRAYRIGHALVEDAWERTANELDLDPEVRWRALAQAFRFFFVYVDAVCVQLTQEYADERARWIRGSAATRAEMVRALLDGERVPAAKVSAALGYDVAAQHVGFVLWADPEAPDPGSAGALEGLAATAARTLGDGPSMLVPVGNWVVWGWVTIDPGTAASAERFALPSGVRAAVGNPAGGLDGFVGSHHEAMQARHVARLQGRRSASIVRYRAVALLGLQIADPLAALRFVDAELAALAADDDSMARLRATLRVYFEENASPARTSRRLSINKNTVVYRVSKAEEILGHPVLERRSELDAALRLFDVRDGLRDVVAQAATGHAAQSRRSELT